MSNTHQIKTTTTNVVRSQKSSALERFNLGFEYDKTLREIKREVRARTI